MQLADHHLWLGHVADMLGGTFTPRRVWEEVSEYYARAKISAADRRSFVDSIRDSLN